MKSCLRFVLLCALFFTPARAVEEDPDTEVAKRHYARGGAYYDAKDYAGALAEFGLARRVLASPAIDYNIARCYDRLENYAAAADYYQRYVDGAPQAADAEPTRQRIAVLRKRAGESTPPPASAAPPPNPAEPSHPVVAAPISPTGGHEGGARKWPIAVGVVAGVVVVAGISLGLGFGFGDHTEPVTATDLGPMVSTP